jgi:hypothetical protein
MRGFDRLGVRNWDIGQEPRMVKNGRVADEDRE